MNFGCEILNIVPGRVSTEVDAAPSFDTEEAVTNNCFKKFGYQTQVMGASFRKVDQIVRLAGCDLLTISPDLLAHLEKTQGEVRRCLGAEKARASGEKKIHLDEKTFRWTHSEDAMAREKLSEGIRRFNADTRKLEQFARTKVETLMAA